MCAWWMLIASSTQIPRTRSSRRTKPNSATAPTAIQARLGDHARVNAAAAGADAAGAPGRRPTYVPPETDVASVAMPTARQEPLVVIVVVVVVVVVGAVLSLLELPLLWLLPLLPL